MGSTVWAEVAQGVFGSATAIGLLEAALLQASCDGGGGEGLVPGWNSSDCTHI